VATFTAAALGNMIYHFLQGYYYVPQMGLGNAFIGFLPYAFYATLLGIGIGISVIRNQGKDRLPNHAPWWRKALATSGVIVFFTFLGIFDLEGRSIQLNQCFHFLFRLFSISI